MPRTDQIIGRMLGRYLDRVSRVSRIRWTLTSAAGDFTGDSQAVADSLDQSLSNGPVILALWNAHSLNFAAATLGTLAIRSFAQSLSVVADDSFGGRITRSLLEDRGFRPALLNRIDPVERLNSLKVLIENGPRIVIAIDSHGPYRTVGSAIARLAIRSHARLIAVSAVSTARVHMFRKIGMALPHPGCQIAVLMSELPPAVSEHGIRAIQASLQDTLTRGEAIAFKQLQ